MVTVLTVTGILLSHHSTETRSLVELTLYSMKHIKVNLLNAALLLNASLAT